jgi:hypothetical protein
MPRQQKSKSALQLLAVGVLALLTVAAAQAPSPTAVPTMSQVCVHCGMHALR